MPFDTVGDNASADGDVVHTAVDVYLAVIAACYRAVVNYDVGVVVNLDYFSIIRSIKADTQMTKDKILPVYFNSRFVTRYGASIYNNTCTGDVSPAIVRYCLAIYSCDVKCIVPLTSKTILFPGATPLAAATAARKLPVPESFKFVT